MRKTPNIVLVLADDLGYSDIGCYGGEIQTPELDRLGRDGVRLSQFYNTARCSPSRASLLTGLHPHQTGIGVLTNDDSPDGYPGSLNEQCVTMAEVLRGAGYATCLAGKWHMSSAMTEPDESWPTRRGFERFFGTITGCGSFYDPGTLRRGEDDASAEAKDPDFFYTDAISAEAESFIRDETAGAGTPFFLSVCYTAPHWPLHAPEEDIRRYDGVYDAGWDELRERRMKAMVQERIMPPGTAMSDRDPAQPAWSDADEKSWQALRMQAYAAQVDRMDRGIGRIVRALRDTEQWENTVFVFLSDNGASPEELPKVSDEAFRERTDILPRATRDGREMRVGNTPDIAPGAEDTYASYGSAWANLSNTPFRYYKRWVHEGGIATPFIVHWPAGQLRDGEVLDTPFQLVDVLPTVLELTGARYPDEREGHRLPAPEGCSMLPTLRGDGDGAGDDRDLCWEHTGNAAIRHRHWKLVREHPHDWELYDLDRDRSELHDLASAHPDVVAELSQRWRHWADRVGVLPWETTLRLYAGRGLTEEEAAG